MLRVKVNQSFLNGEMERCMQMNEVKRNQPQKERLDLDSILFFSRLSVLVSNLERTTNGNAD